MQGCPFFVSGKRFNVPPNTIDYFGDNFTGYLSQPKVSEENLDELQDSKTVEVKAQSSGRGGSAGFVLQGYICIFPDDYVFTCYCGLGAGSIHPF